MRKSWRVVAIVFLVLGFARIQIKACSVCRCGDNAFLFSEQSFGMPGLNQEHRFWLSVGNLYSVKSNAHHHHEDSAPEIEGTERIREIRPSVRLAYTASNHFSLTAEAPMQFRQIDMTMASETSHEQSSGFGDIELSAIWMQNLWHAGGRYISVGLSLTSKLPTGNNKIEKDGERIDEHLQAGSGTFDWQIGAALSRSTHNNLLFTSTYYRINGTNDFAYEYGDAWLLNLGIQRSLSSLLTGILQINSRYAQHDLEDGQLVENTGGWMMYLTPGVKLNLTEAIGLSASVQIPVYQNLYGIQSEKAVLSTGVSYQF